MLISIHKIRKNTQKPFQIFTTLLILVSLSFGLVNNVNVKANITENFDYTDFLSLGDTFKITQGEDIESNFLDVVDSSLGGLETGDSNLGEEFEQELAIEDSFGVVVNLGEDLDESSSDLDIDKTKNSSKGGINQNCVSGGTAAQRAIGLQAVKTASTFQGLPIVSQLLSNCLKGVGKTKLVLDKRVGERIGTLGMGDNVNTMYINPTYLNPNDRSTITYPTLGGDEVTVSVKSLLPSIIVHELIHTLQYTSGAEIYFQQPACDYGIPNKNEAGAIYWEQKMEEQQGIPIRCSHSRQ